MVTGGQGTGGASKAAHIYSPKTGQFCSLPDMNEAIYDYTQDGSLICGSWDSNHIQSCSKWNSDSGIWNWKFLSLPKSKQAHASWTPQSGVGTYLMGGSYDPQKTNLVKPDGTVELHGFDLYASTVYV